MRTGRLRARHDRFELRGWTYAFHHLRDAGPFSRLETDTDEVQALVLHSGQTVEIHPGDLEIICPQIGYPVPGRRRAGMTGPAPAEPQIIERIVEVEKPVEIIREVERVVVDESALAEALSRASAAEAELAELRAEIEGRGVPEVQQRMAPEWMDVREGETLAEAARRLTDQFRAELNNLTNKRLDGQRVDQARMNELNRMIEELAMMGDA